MSVSRKDTSTPEEAKRELTRYLAFGPYRFDLATHQLSEGGAPVRVGARALAILRILMETPGRLVPKMELLERGWPGLNVDEANLKVQVSNLRKALKEHGRVIRAEAALGYRFTGEVEASGEIEAARSEANAEAAPGALNNLPHRAVKIIGRAEAIAAVSRDLETFRLVSLTGPGGVGKTTVALAVAKRSLGAFRDGVWFIDLARVRDSSLVPNTVAAAVGLTADAPDALAALLQHLRTRQTLLAFDNCEHMIDAVAVCVDLILSHAGGVKVLATSRELLRVKGERVRRLDGLATPPSVAELTAADALAYPAVQLFVERAADRMATFGLSDADSPIAAELCRRLDGLPLAIELAATRIDSFGLSGLLAQFDDSFQLLAGHRGAPERHRKLSAMIDWSYELLPENEQALLRRLAVFPGPFDLDSACSVAGEGARAQSVDELANLVAKSLVAAEIGAESVIYRLLETTRAYSVDRLRASGEEPALRLLHAEYTCSALQQAAREWTATPAKDWERANGRRLDDLRAALDWLGGRGNDPALAVQLTVAGSLLWNHFSLTEECRVRVSRALDAVPLAGLAGSAAEMQLQLSFAGSLIFTRGVGLEAHHALRRALDIANEIEDVNLQLRCLRMMGVAHLFAGEHEAGSRALETFVSLAEKKDPSAVISGESHLACADLFLGRLVTSRKRLQRFYDRHLDNINETQATRFLYNDDVDVGNVMSHVKWLMGFADSAMRISEATVEFAARTKHKLSLSNALAWACLTAFLNKRYDECERHVDRLDDEFFQHVIWRTFVTFYRGALAALRPDTAEAGLVLLHRALAEFRETRHHARMPFHLAVLADTLFRTGRLDQAASIIDSALAWTRDQNELWSLPEVLRVQASIFVAQGRPEAAEAALLEAMARASDMGAIAWRLRAANDLSQLWRAKSRSAEAKAVLRPIFDEFTEGFETTDLLAAAAFLGAKRGGREPSRGPLNQTGRP